MSKFDKLDELLFKFENGHEKYRESALFYKTIDALLNGNDQLAIIDQLIKMNEECREIIEFVEWCDDIGYTQVANSFWKSLNDEKEKTTKELFEQFKKKTQLKPY